MTRTRSRLGSDLIRKLLLSVCAVGLAAIGGCAGQSSESQASESQADYSPEVRERLVFVSTLFTGAEQVENFNRLKDLFPSQKIAASTSPYVFPKGAPIELPESYSFQGVSRSGSELLDETRTTALIIVQGGKIRHEQYWLTGGEDINWMSMSVAKSFISALVGIAIAEGDIAGVESPITDYVPELAGSAYDGVRIKDVLQMSSGARWNEDYSDPESDIMRYGQVWAGAGSGSFDEFTASLTRERPPGTYNYYNSTDTQALGMLLARATGLSVSEYAQQKLWQPLGMQHDGYWITDGSGVEMAAGGLQVTALDYAKLGQLYLQKGKWGGMQIVPERWVEDSLVADSEHLTAAAHPEYPVGYGYQWWLPVSDEGEFSAIGVYNQFVYVNPARDLVIVKLSANPDYGLTNDESSFRELETFEYFRAIGAEFSRSSAE